jgi:hypothetical protein
MGIRPIEYGRRFGIEKFVPVGIYVLSKILRRFFEETDLWNILKRRIGPLASHKDRMLVQAGYIGPSAGSR